MKDLENIVNKYIIKALELTRDEIAHVIAKKVLEYYSEDVFSPPDTATPDTYVRTGKMANNFQKSDIITVNNGFEFWCGWDDDYLTFRYPKGFNGKGKIYNGITGKEVLDAFNSATHGYTVQGKHNYWYESITELGGDTGITDLFRQNCKKVGLPIR